MAMGEEPERPDTRGLALAAISLTIGTISRLQANGTFDLLDIGDVFGASLGSIEDRLPPNDHAARDARALLEALQAFAIDRSRTRPTRQQ